MSFTVTFLGTGSGPPTRRNLSSFHVEREGESFLFEAPEATQMQLFEHTNQASVSKIFISEYQPDNVLGIPGLITTYEFQERQEPLHIYIHEAAEAKIEHLIETVKSPSYPLEIHPISEDEIIVDDSEYEIKTFSKSGQRANSIGYLIKEDDHRGRFNREKAEHELGIPPGPKYRQLTSGESIELDDGRTISPEQVLGPDRPGRSVAYTGDIRRTDEILDAVEEANLLIHEATFPGGRESLAHQIGHSTAADAAEIAARANVERLALIHLSYEHSREEFEDTAGEEFDGELNVPVSGQSVDIPVPEGRPAEQSHNQVKQTQGNGGKQTDIDPQTSEMEAILEQESNGVTTREVTRTEPVRNRELVDTLKEMYDNTCQICDTRRMKSPNEGYSIVHHIHPLSADGPDRIDNMIVVCPNHHEDFENGMIGFEPDLKEILHYYEKEVHRTKLTETEDHNIGKEYLKYHNQEEAHSQIFNE